MNILLLGSGGREHALAWKIAQSDKCDTLFIAPGNAGTSACGKNVELSPTDFPAIERFCAAENIHMIVVGPEDPLVQGVYDYFTERNIPVIGPSQAAAQLEGSKAFAKGFMARHNIPTAAYQQFDESNLEAGYAFIDQQPTPIVLKADGLAAGKGVLICTDRDEAKASLKEMVMEAKFGDASKHVVIEAFLDGIEFSVFTLTDGDSYKILPTAKDYKRIGEGDTGLNTGGMGAVSPVPFVDDALMQKVIDQIIEPTIKGLKSEGLTYKGFIYFGLIRVAGEPMVIEYNCRMGDPETEAVIPRIESDLLAHFEAISNNTLAQEELVISSKAAATVMLVSGGYPNSYPKGKVMTGMDASSESLLFHAGTKMDGEQVVTNGGRVLAITSFGADLQSALNQSLNQAEVIDFDGKFYRKDIGYEFI